MLSTSEIQVTVTRELRTEPRCQSWRLNLQVMSLWKGCHTLGQFNFGSKWVNVFNTYGCVACKPVRGHKRIKERGNERRKARWGELINRKGWGCCSSLILDQLGHASLALNANS